ncbi:MAG: acyl-CoA dehydrogenase family protein [Caulobacteraceae bacterium]|nr:acyl-CoA dehydrogenase family protein [Caulobacteraceae bacterium]
MDFTDTPEEAAYREKARAWLIANAPKQGLKPGRDHDGSDLAEARAWQTKKAAAGYAQITWPKEWGGPGGTPIQSVIYAQEEAKFAVNSGYFLIGLGMCIPTVMAFADEETKKRFVGPALRGEEIWCQLFSEPSGGSDAAAARTRAVRDGDEWVINGQKIWTSGAHLSDYGILLARTDIDVPKHKGMTMFWIDMRSPGVEIRPIHQMSGASGFNEVFFTDMRIKDSQRLGPVGDGWKVAIVTLMNERLSVGDIRGLDPAQFLRLAREVTIGGESAARNHAFREKIADWYVQFEGLKHTRMRTITSLSRGQTPGPENSIGKVVAANVAQEMAREAMEMLDQFGIINDPSLAPLAAGFQNQVLATPGNRIAGGTDEIMRNIIAERVLGLPGDVRLDKDVAFKDIPSWR